MTRFIIKCIAFSGLAIASFLGVFLMENGGSDPYYQRLNKDIKKSLIVGNSKAAQGLQPSVINEMLDLPNGSEIFNFSFTLLDSPFGEIYTNSIMRKLDQNSSNGIFIVAVDPWSFTSSKEDPNNKNLFIEKNRFLSKLFFFNTPVNIQYLLFHFSKSYYEIPVNNFRKRQSTLHQDGWLEISIIEKSDSDYIKRLKVKEDLYLDKLKYSSFSKKRFESFVDLIKLLSLKGDVFIVQLPIDNDLMYLDNLLINDFEAKIDSVSDLLLVPHLDLTPFSNQFKYTDGNHLTPESGEQVSEIIAEWIRKL